MGPTLALPLPLPLSRRKVSSTHARVASGRVCGSRRCPNPNPNSKPKPNPNPNPTPTPNPKPNPNPKTNQVPAAAHVDEVVISADLEAISLRAVVSLGAELRAELRAEEAAEGAPLPLVLRIAALTLTLT